jgi:hemerythrin
MALQWTRDLAVGVDTIDRQHQEMFHRLDNLLESMKKSKGQEELEEVISRLSLSVVSAFGTEEKLMRMYEYPAMLAHKAIHDKFVLEFGELKQGLLAGKSPELANPIQSRVVDWLKTHIGQTDKALGEFLNSRRSLPGGNIMVGRTRIKIPNR